MATNNIFYSRENDNGTFTEKVLVPSASHFVICGPCGDLTTFTGSFDLAGVTVLDGGVADSIYGELAPIDGGTAASIYY
jgi:hypothetical protein